VTAPTSPSVKTQAAPLFVPALPQASSYGSRVALVDSGAFFGFTSASQWLSALGVPLSPGDADTLELGRILPGTYTENLVVPAYRHIEIAAENLPQVITGNVTWKNVAGRGAAAPSQFAVLALRNLDVTGNLTVADDATVLSYVFIADDYNGNNALHGPSVQGNVDLTGATLCGSVDLIHGYVEGNITSRADKTGASVWTYGAEIDGNVTAQYIGLEDTYLYGSRFTVRTDVENGFYCNGCRFGGTAPTITGQALFDAPSWASFRRAGGSMAAGSNARVIGGFSGGAVRGADYVDISSTTVVSLSGGGASSVYTSGGNWYTVPAATLGGDRTIELSHQGALYGDTLKITRLDTTLHALTVQDEGGTPLVVMPGLAAHSSLFQFDGAHFVVVDP
jgi:hypothetical protein